MNIEKAHRKDRPKIKALIASYPKILLQTHLPRTKAFFVAREIEEGEIVGCCALVVYSKRIAEIRSLAVLGQFAKNGVGHALVDACIQEARRRGIYEVLTITGANKVGFFAQHGLISSTPEQKVALISVLGEKTASIVP